MKLCAEWGRSKNYVLETLCLWSIIILNKKYDEKYKITYKDFSGAYGG